MASPSWLKAPVLLVSVPEPPAAVAGVVCSSPNWLRQISISAPSPRMKGPMNDIKQGRRRLVPVSALAEYVASLESGLA